MRTAGIAKLKAELSSYLESVKAGEQVVVTDRGKPVAMIIPIDPSITMDERRAEAIAKGLVKPGRPGGVPAEIFEKSRIPGLTAEKALEAVMAIREDRV